MKLAFQLGTVQPDGLNIDISRYVILTVRALLFTFAGYFYTHALPFNVAVFHTEEGFIHPKRLSY